MISTGGAYCMLIRPVDLNLRQDQDLILTVLYAQTGR